MARGRWLGKATDGFISRHVNRRVSQAVTRLLLRSGRAPSPNAVTLATSFIGFLSLPAYATLTPLGAAVGGVLAQLSSVLDGVDGEIARATGRTSPYGAVLDATLDRIVDGFAFTGASYACGAALGLGAASALLAGLVVLGNLLVSYLHARAEASMSVKAQVTGRLRCWASRDVRLFILFIGSLLVPLLGWLPLLGALVATAVLSYSYVAAKLVDLYYWWRSSVAERVGGGGGVQQH